MQRPGTGAVRPGFVGPRGRPHLAYCWTESGLGGCVKGHRTGLPAVPAVHRGLVPGGGRTTSSRSAAGLRPTCGGPFLPPPGVLRAPLPTPSCEAPATRASIQDGPVHTRGPAGRNLARVPYASDHPEPGSGLSRRCPGPDPPLLADLSGLFQTGWWRGARELFDAGLLGPRGRRALW